MVVESWVIQHHIAASHQLIDLAACMLQMLEVTLPFDEVALLEQNREYLQRACNLPNTPLAVHLVAAGADPVAGQGAQPQPGKPASRIETRPAAS